MKNLKCIRNAFTMVPEVFRHVQRWFLDALGDVECLTASSSPGNQVDGLPGDCSNTPTVVLGRKKDHRKIMKNEVGN